jgi:hypothetical protein
MLQLQPEANMLANPARISTLLAIFVLLLAFAAVALAFERGGDVLMIACGLFLAATSMSLFRRAHAPPR